jgi:hypothetical protein
LGSWAARGAAPDCRRHLPLGLRYDAGAFPPPTGLRSGPRPLLLGGATSSAHAAHTGRARAARGPRRAAACLHRTGGATGAPAAAASALPAPPEGSRSNLECREPGLPTGAGALGMRGRGGPRGGRVCGARGGRGTAGAAAAAGGPSTRTGARCRCSRSRRRLSVSCHPIRRGARQPWRPGGGQGGGDGGCACGRPLESRRAGNGWGVDEPAARREPRSNYVQLMLDTGIGAPRSAGGIFAGTGTGRGAFAGPRAAAACTQRRAPRPRRRAAATVAPAPPAPASRPQIRRCGRVRAPEAAAPCLGAPACPTTRPGLVSPDPGGAATIRLTALQPTPRDFTAHQRPRPRPRCLLPDSAPRPRWRPHPVLAPIRSTATGSVRSAPRRATGARARAFSAPP